VGRAVRAHAAIRAEADGAGRTRLTLVRSQAPLVLRPTADAVYLAAAAGGPLGGDDLRLDVEVGPQATLTLRTVGATIALPGRDGESSMAMHLTVAEGGRLAVLPEPTVVAARARHRCGVRAEIADGATLYLREEVVLGRHGETGGTYRGRTDVDVASAPLLRHELVLDGDQLGRASVAGARATGSVLIVDPMWTPSVGDPSVMRLAGSGTLITALADDALTLRRQLDAHGCWLLTETTSPVR
jgi:urease accessory protein